MILHRACFCLWVPCTHGSLRDHFAGAQETSIESIISISPRVWCLFPHPRLFSRHSIHTLHFGLAPLLVVSSGRISYSCLPVSGWDLNGWNPVLSGVTLNKVFNPTRLQGPPLKKQSDDLPHKTVGRIK